MNLSDRLCPIMTTADKEVNCKCEKCAFFVQAAIPICSVELIARNSVGSNNLSEILARASQH
jgi:hypothetical protein